MICILFMFKKIFKKKNSLNKLFYPKSVAVIGASNDLNKIGGYIFSQILKNKNIKTFPINVKWEEIQKHKAYTSILNVKDEIDLVIIAIPAQWVISSIEDIIKKGIKNVVVISAGFKEIGENGLILEHKIKELVKKNNLNLIGPNCLGFLNVENKLNCSFAKDIPKFGNVALISQSGAVIDGIIDWSFKKNIGFSKIVSLGNMAGVSELDILDYLKDDKKTGSIIFYMETLENGEEFALKLKEITKKKPVIIIKPGNSKQAQNAIGSHTGSLAQNNVLVKTLILENNGILVETLDELFNMLIALKTKITSSNNNDDDDNNNNLIILTNAGGPGVLATDYVENTSFKLFKFNQKEKEQIKFLPKEASLNNPIDILGDAKSERYEQMLEIISNNDKIANVLILLTPQIMTDSENIANSIVKFSNKNNKNIACCFIGDKEVKNAVEILDKNNVATFSSPAAALNSLNKLFLWNNFKYESNHRNYNFNIEKQKYFQDKIKNKKGLLDFELTKEIFEELLLINLPKKQIIKSLEDIEKINIEKNKKYVLKGDSKELIHKKDIGGVVLDITHLNYKEEIHKMFDILFEKFDEFTITVEEEVKGVETIIGLKSEKDLGNFIMFGSGGTYVSIYNDISWAKCPLSESKCKSLIDSTKVSQRLNGFRGSKKIHFKHLYEIMIRLSYLQELLPEIKEIDLNPVIASENGIYLVDVKLIC